MFKRILSVLGAGKPAAPEMVAPEPHSLLTGTVAADELIVRGNQFEDRGELAEAVSCYQQALARSPEYAKAHINLGNGFLAMGRTAEAAEAFENALRRDPANPFAHFNLGITRQLLGQHDKAAVSLEAALRSKPEFAAAYIALADSRDTLGDDAAAIASLRKALTIEPDHPGALHNLAQLLFRDGLLDEAEALLVACLAINPDYLEAMVLLGEIRKNQGALEDAVDTFRNALQRDPVQREARSNLLLTLNYIGNLSPRKIFEAHCEAGSYLDLPASSRPPTRMQKQTDRRIRIGYVSGDFRNHPVSVFIEPVFANHDRANFLVYAYNNCRTQDATSARLKGLVDNWRDICALDDAAASAMIENDQIDILVDLSGHTGLNRLALFALKPAPIQVTWLGYLNTTGMAAMDYRLCDACTDPPGVAEQYHKEQLWRLPDSQWCYRPVGGAYVPAAESPLSRNGYPTFGSFNNFVKISQATVDLWSRLLAHIPAARLRIIGVPPGRAGAGLLLRFRNCGISESRLELRPRLAYEDYMAAFSQVDIALDTFPYNGGTTTCDALWMGTPVVCLAGETSVSRSGISILTTSGFGELIAKDAGDYLAIHKGLIDHPAQLHDFRAAARKRFGASPMMDEARFTRGLENAFTQMQTRTSDRA